MSTEDSILNKYGGLARNNLLDVTHLTDIEYFDSIISPPYQTTDSLISMLCKKGNNPLIKQGNSPLIKLSKHQCKI